jgi:hypothetical protein
VTGHCPGLTLSGVRVQGFKRYGVVVINCDGESGRPVLFDRLQTGATSDTVAAVFFDAIPEISRIDQFITLRDCRFEGDYQAPLAINHERKDRNGQPVKVEEILGKLDLDGKNVVAPPGKPETPAQRPQ